MKKRSKTARALRVGMFGVVAATPGAACGPCLSFTEEWDTPVADSSEGDSEVPDLGPCLSLAPPDAEVDDDVLDVGVCLSVDIGSDDLDAPELDAEVRDSLEEADVLGPCLTVLEPEVGLDSCLADLGSPDTEYGDAGSDIDALDAEGSGEGDADASEPDADEDADSGSGPDIGPCLSPPMDGGGASLEDGPAGSRHAAAEPASSLRAAARAAVRAELADRGVLPADVAMRLDVGGGSADTSHCVDPVSMATSDEPGCSTATAARGEAVIGGGERAAVDWPLRRGHLVAGGRG